MKSFFNIQIAITLEPKVVDPYNPGDSWSLDRDLSSGKAVPFSGGGLLGGNEEKPKNLDTADKTYWAFTFTSNVWGTPSSSATIHKLSVGFKSFVKLDIALRNNAKSCVDFAKPCLASQSSWARWANYGLLLLLNDLHEWWMIFLSFDSTVFMLIQHTYNVLMFQELRN